MTRGWTRRAGALTLALAVAVTGAACGGDDDGPAAALERIDEQLVPAEVAGGELKFFPRTDDATTKAFANAGGDTLQADARLWELRAGERLVGALQVTTVVPDVDLTNKSDRDELLRQIIVGSVNRLEIDDTPVWVTATDDKVVYVWFGRTLFQVLQLKGTRLDAEAVLTDVVRYQTALPAWDPIDPEDYELDA